MSLLGIIVISKTAKAILAGMAGGASMDLVGGTVTYRLNKAYDKRKKVKFRPGLIESIRKVANQ